LLWVAALLLLCVAHGLWTVSGLSYPLDVDSLRDIGFAQGILDGDLFGDPVYAGEVRWYPPLVPSLAAAASRLLGIVDLPAFWVHKPVPGSTSSCRQRSFWQRGGCSARPLRQRRR